MRAVNVTGTVQVSNPLFAAVDLADAGAAEAERNRLPALALTNDIMGDEYAVENNPDAFAVVYGQILSFMPLLNAMSSSTIDVQSRQTGVLEFIWAYACDAYNHACDTLGDDADRRVPLAYAHVIAGYFRAWGEQMRIEMLLTGRSSQ
ncbi:hypothetical protein [Pararobbsia silviterrae]|uniref:Uncharacterized protein n=1 Tax=Pararobbsia silviterrae TaxID=1792498 RepID=A0A494Y1N6_9BURK|nr:hypothetical protein [Pararobbsia silviterrae]RKP56617.1 hypothetical protein D7S86_09660 [Pararobbsia silviterrae]